jgi:hypothetical protein
MVQNENWKEGIKVSCVRFYIYIYIITRKPSEVWSVLHFLAVVWKIKFYILNFILITYTNNSYSLKKNSTKNI